MKYTVTRTGRDQWTPPAKSGLSRQHTHGKLLPMDRPEGEPSLLAGTALLIGIAIAATLLIVGLT